MKTKYKLVITPFKKLWLLPHSLIFGTAPFENFQNLCLVCFFFNIGLIGLTTAWKWARRCLDCPSWTLLLLELDIWMKITVKRISDFPEYRPKYVSSDYICDTFRISTSDFYFGNYLWNTSDGISDFFYIVTMHYVHRILVVMYFGFFGKAYRSL